MAHKGIFMVALILGFIGGFALVMTTAPRPAALAFHAGH